MKKLTLLFAGLMPLLASAQEVVVDTANEVLGKPDIIQPAESGPIISFVDILKLAMAVAVVALIMKFALPAVMRKMGGKLSPGVGSSIKVEESATIANGQLYVVSVRGKTLLLAAATSGVSLLSDLTESNEEIEAEMKAKPAFFEVLDNAAKSEEGEASNESRMWFAISDAENAPAVAEVDEDDVQTEDTVFESVSTEAENQIDLEHAKQLLMAAKQRIGAPIQDEPASASKKNFVPRANAQPTPEEPKRALSPEEALARLDRLTSQ